MNATFDTLSYIKRLEASGVSNVQAEAHATALSEAIGTRNASKDDLQSLKNELLTKMEMDRQLQDGATRELGLHIHNDVIDQKAEILRWVFALWLTQNAILFGALSYFHH